jgi:uncharacterized protein YbjT (DUF2867 family)
MSQLSQTGSPARHLVAGATGNIGARMVNGLLARGWRPRVLVRDADKARALFGDRVDYALGDLSDARSLVAACAGVDAMFLVNSGTDLARRDRLAAEAAKAAGRWPPGQALLTGCARDGRRNQTLAVTGPAALTYAEMTALIAAAIGRPLTFVALSDEEARATLARTGMPLAMIDALVTLWREVREGQVAVVTGDVERIAGREPIGFRRWAEDNAAAFR